MPITVTRELRGLIRRFPDSIGLLVETPREQQEAAMAALAAATTDISNLDGGWRSAPGLSPEDRNNPKYVSAVLPTALGPVITIDGGYTPMRLLRTIPEVVAARLAAAGVTEARIRAAPYGTVPRAPQAVTLRWYLAPPPTEPHEPIARLPIPPSWLDLAAEWVCADPLAGDEVQVVVDTTGFPLPAREAAAFLHSAVTKPGLVNVALMAGEPGSRIRAAVAFGGRLQTAPSVALAEAGPAQTPTSLRRVFDTLVETGRTVAQTASYTYCTFDPDLGSAANSIGGSFEWQGQRSPDLYDMYVPDAFPYQVLGPGHIRRLGGRPSGSRTLDESHVEVSIGEPSEWLLDPRAALVEPTPYIGLSAWRRNPAVQRAGRELLQACLVPLDTDEWVRIMHAKFRTGRFVRDP